MYRLTWLLAFVSLQGAFALLSPWQIFAARVGVSLGSDPCVRIGKLEEPLPPRDGYVIPVSVCNQDKAETLATLVGGTRTIAGAPVDIDFTGPRGSALPRDLSGIDYKDAEQWIRAALSGNRLFSGTVRTTTPEGLWILIQRRVVQYYADNIADLYLQNNETAELAFRQVLNLSAFGPLQIHTSTVKARMGYR